MTQDKDYVCLLIKLSHYLMMTPLKDDVLFFGLPLDLSRNYNLLFRKGRDSAAYVTKIYWAMARETYGDHFKSSCLNMAFNKKILEI